MTNCAEAGVIHFDVLELDISSGELRTAGTLVSLQPQPFKILALLAGHSGQAITREEIRQQLWGTKTSVDFEGGLNFCVRQIRKALGEDARKPRYIETLRRRGYRFVAQVNRVGQTPVKSTVRLPSHPQPVSQHMPITLAVLPFSDLGFSPQPHCLAEGITELLITYFSTNSSLRVVSRTSTMKYKHTKKSLPRIGRELGVDRVLEGVVLHSGARVRITARLIDTSTDRNEWAACYEGKIMDSLVLQEKIAWAVTRDAAVHLERAQAKRAATTGPAGAATAGPAFESLHFPPHISRPHQRVLASRASVS